MITILSLDATRIIPLSAPRSASALWRGSAALGLARLPLCLWLWVSLSLGPRRARCPLPLLAVVLQIREIAHSIIYD